MANAIRCKICRRCLPADAYSPSALGARSGRHAPSHVCRECKRAENSRKMRSLRDWIGAYKMERGCADCGYQDSPVALQFDHLPGFEKEAKVGDLVSRGNLERIQAEIAKCDVVCANCHAIRTQTRGEAAGWRSAYHRGIGPLPPPLEDPQLRLDGIA